MCIEKVIFDKFSTGRNRNGLINGLITSQHMHLKSQSCGNV